jgi:hypothetical protein
MKPGAAMLSFGIVSAVACGSGSSATHSGPGRAASTIPSGQWGGPHVSLEAADTGAALEFDCAHGSIKAPLSLGADGRFHLPGTFIREHGGPIRIGEAEDSQEARYSGTIRGATMTLSIELARDQITDGPFTLQFESPGKIFKCR